MFKKDAAHFVPCINALQYHVKKLHEENGSFMSKKEIRDQAWTVRYLFGLLKQLTNKDSPPTETCCKYMLNF